MDYPVPNFGVDHEILAADTGLAYAEKQLKHKLVIDPKPEYPTDYPVPNFGVDHDIIETKESIATTEDKLNHDWVPTQDENGYWSVPQPFDNSSYNYHNRDVFVQLGQEMSSDPICSSAGCTQYEHPKVETYPMDYPVANFGVDHDILANHNSLDIAQKQLKHTWTWEEHKKEDPVLFDDRKALPDLDVDIQHSFSSMGQQEDIHGPWNPTQDEDGNWIVPQPIDNRSYSYEGDAANVMLRDDPICSSAGCTQFKHPEVKSHPMDYPVPSFGADPDMETTHNSIAMSEERLGHKIVMGTDESKAQWENPATKVDYNFAPALDHDIVVTHTNLGNAEAALGERMVQLRDDPICSSAGCPKGYMETVVEPKIVQYPAPTPT